MMMKIGRNFFIVSLTVLALATGANSQTTAFSYQGQLTDGGTPANGSFQIRFRLFDDPASGSQQGPTLTDVPATVTNGAFSAKLDFGSAVFGGGNRWIEVSVRRNSGESYVTLSPREQITSSPYALKSLAADTAANATNAGNSSQLGGLPPSRYVQSDANGNVGIGASPVAGSKLTVGGQLEITSGGIKFPNATTQTTAGLISVITAAPLTGNGTAGSPLGITTPLVIRDADQPARQFVQFAATPDLSTVYTVPAGKVLVIEYVNGFIISANDTLALVLITASGAGGTTEALYVPAKTWTQVNTVTRNWLISEQVRLYATPGQTITTQYSVQTTSQLIRIRGYLISIP